MLKMARRGFTSSTRARTVSMSRAGSPDARTTKRHAEVGHLRPVLRNRIIDFRRRRTIEVDLADVGDDADDAAAIHLEADGIRRTEIRPCERLVDENNGRRVRRVCCVDAAPSSYLNAERLEISRRHETKLNRKGRVLTRRRTFHDKICRVAPPAPVLQRQDLRKSRGTHPGNLRHTVGDVVVLRFDSLGRRLAQMKRHHVLGLHAHV